MADMIARTRWRGYAALSTVQWAGDGCDRWVRRNGEPWGKIGGMVTVFWRTRTGREGLVCYDDGGNEWNLRDYYHELRIVQHAE